MSTTPPEGYAFIKTSALLPQYPVACIQLWHLLNPPPRSPGESISFDAVEGYLVAARVFGLRNALPVGRVDICTAYQPGALSYGAPPPDLSRTYVIVSDEGAPVLVVPMTEWQQKISAFLDAHGATP